MWEAHKVAKIQSFKNSNQLGYTISNLHENNTLDSNKSYLHFQMCQPVICNAAMQFERPKYIWNAMRG